MLYLVLLSIWNGYSVRMSEDKEPVLIKLVHSICRVWWTAYYSRMDFTNTYHGSSSYSRSFSGGLFSKKHRMVNLSARFKIKKRRNHLVMPPLFCFGDQDFVFSLPRSHYSKQGKSPTSQPTEVACRAYFSTKSFIFKLFIVSLQWMT